MKNFLIGYAVSLAQVIGVIVAIVMAFVAIYCIGAVILKVQGRMTCLLGIISLIFMILILALLLFLSKGG